jgi:hypothetical protein
MSARTEPGAKFLGALRALIVPCLLLGVGLLSACGHDHYYDPPYYEECYCDPFGCDCYLVYYKDDASPDEPAPDEVW